jgi:hypothetical protein
MTVFEIMKPGESLQLELSRRGVITVTFVCACGRHIDTGSMRKPALPENAEWFIKTVAERGRRTCSRQS